MFACPDTSVQTGLSTNDLSQTASNNCFVYLVILQTFDHDSSAEMLYVDIHSFMADK